MPRLLADEPEFPGASSDIAKGPKCGRGFSLRSHTSQALTCSWTKPGAEHLAQLLWLQTHPLDWSHWWTKTALAKTKVNPGPSSPRPPN